MGPGPQPRLACLDLRTLGYDEAFAEQVRLRDACIEGAGPECLMLVEHTPTVTIGRTGSRQDVLVDAEALAKRGIAVVETNRGGEATYHGPGQLVAYPIIDLRRRGRDLHRYLRDLEAWLVGLCSFYGVPAHADSPHTGVWVEDRKIASIGIAVRQWVAYHGVALNVTTDLTQFGLIVPCGLRGVTMTSLERELGTAPALADVARRAAESFARYFGMDLTPVEAGALEGR
jgi:lipoate-protein ligase B